LNLTSSVQQRHTNQYSHPLGLSFLYLKLQPCSRQIVQHISWSQGHSTSLLISKSILRTSSPVWTASDTHTGINKQLVKEEKIKTEPIDRSFEVFNIDKTKNGEVIEFVPLKVKINRYKEQINVVVTDLNSIDMFLGYNWLVKHNPEVNWNMETIQFTKYSWNYKM